METYVEGSPKDNEARKDFLEDTNTSIQETEDGSIATGMEMAESEKMGSTIKGVSMIELFTPNQVQEHITSLRRWVAQSKEKSRKNQAMDPLIGCQLCGVEKLSFDPPPIYCTPCGDRIKRDAVFYTAGSGNLRYYSCIPCCNNLDGTNVFKARLKKQKNDEATEESWVQCDKCKAWQHQICALFNPLRYVSRQGAEYTCPYCYVEEVYSGERKPLPQSGVLGAKDLPRTILSDHIENRLFTKLQQERLERARFLGKNYDEVPGAEALVVRVVSSVDKKMDVNPQYIEIFQEENFPTEFGYKSKVVLLFQTIEVKYFRPEIRTLTGETLRTFVYHEILIGYLEYCKLRGFTSFYTWACPILNCEDYILNCQSDIQKTAKSDKLKEWYLSMLRKASKENIVVDLTNLYDHFFVSSGECKAKITAARLPYFDGDYWRGAAEDLIYQRSQEEDGRNLNKKDLLLMHMIGEAISPTKEDFIMVHLQHSCTHCCIPMVSGKRWVCKHCEYFMLCDKCHETEQKLEDRERHPINQREKHLLHPIDIENVPTDTTDKDEILESEIFDTREAFLSLCKGNHYQYETLRRAKHSSMMVLYRLHNPTAPALVITCNRCHLDLEMGQGWCCEICPDFDVCNACYQKDGGIDHPHKLTNHSLRDAQNQEGRQLRVEQLRKMLDLLVHASHCRSRLCQYRNCLNGKRLYRHGIQCNVRASGGCLLCLKMWYFLQLHARSCKESQCPVPRCRDLKEYMRSLRQQTEKRRRAAITVMMRQRAAEGASNRG